MPRVPGEVSPELESEPEPQPAAEVEAETAGVTGEQEVPLLTPVLSSPPPSLQPSPLRSGEPDSLLPLSLPLQCIARATVGSKNPPMYVKGQGLSAGFDALCFVSTAALGGKESDEESRQEKPARTGPALQHVIYCGRMSTKEAVELEATLHWSEITCTSCKQSIFF